MSSSRCGAGDDDVSDASDLDLLRRHEPILRFTDGELFFPMSTAPYVEACDLLTGPTLREARIAIPAGELDLEGLAAVGDPAPGEAQFLRFVPEPLNALELRRWQSRPEHRRFSAPDVSPAWVSSPGWSMPASSPRCCFVAESRAALPRQRRSAMTRSARRTLGWSITAASCARTAG